jgi:predicted  nucleic acid-binding Zn-ribbon protein
MPPMPPNGVKVTDQKELTDTGDAVKGAVAAGIPVDQISVQIAGIETLIPRIVEPTDPEEVEVVVIWKNGDDSEDTRRWCVVLVKGERLYLTGTYTDEGGSGGGKSIRDTAPEKWFLTRDAMRRNSSGAEHEARIVRMHHLLAEEAAALSDAKDAAEEVQGELDAVKEDKDRVQGELDAVKEDKDWLQGELDTVREDKAWLQGEFDVVKEDKDRLQGELDTVREDKDRVQGELDTAKTALNAANAELVTTKIGLDSANEKLATANGEKALMQGQLSKANLDLETAAGKLADAEMELEHWKELGGRLEEKLATANGEKALMQGQLETAAGKLADAEMELEHWKELGGRLEEKLADASGKLAALAARVSVMELNPGQEMEVGNVYRMTIGASDIQSAVANVNDEGRAMCWGVDEYTPDSDAAVAAVHAGVAKVGMSNTVYMRTVAGRWAYEGSTRNGVSSYDLPYACNMSYEFLSILPYGEGSLLLDLKDVVYKIE